MGYRLEISELKYKACGGKLYGYIPDDDLKKLKSYKWLFEHNYIDGDEYWSYGCNPQIVLYPDEFKEFIELYNEDCNNNGKEKDCTINKKEIQELLKTKNQIILEWF